MAQYRASGGVWVLVEVVGSLVGWRLPGAWPVRAVLSGAGVRVVLSAWPVPVVAGCRVPGACATRSCAARSSGLTRTSCSVPGAGGRTWCGGVGWVSSVTEAVTWPDASSWCGSWPVRACRGVRRAGASRDRRARSSRDQRPVGLVGRALPRRAASPVGRGWWVLPVRTFSRVGARRPPCLSVPVLVVGRRGGGPRAPAGVHRSGSGRPWGGRPAAGARRCRPAGSGSVACDRGVRCRPGRCGAALAGCEARSGWVPGGCPYVVCQAAAGSFVAGCGS